MATTKSTAKSPAAKRPSPTTGSAKTRGKPAVGTSSRTEPATKSPRKPGAVKPAGVAKRATPVVSEDAGAAKAVRRRTGKASGIPTEQRRHYIEIAAYYIAERRGFAPGNPAEDWAQAEAEIDRMLAAGGPQTGR